MTTGNLFSDLPTAQEVDFGFDCGNMFDFQEFIADAARDLRYWRGKGGIVTGEAQRALFWFLAPPEPGGMSLERCCQILGYPSWAVDSIRGKIRRDWGWLLTPGQQALLKSWWKE